MFFSKRFLFLLVLFVSSFSYAETAQEQLQGNLLGSWGGTGNIFLSSTQTEITFLNDGTFQVTVTIDNGWLFGKSTVDSYGSYEILSESQVRMSPNGQAEYVSDYSRPSKNVLMFKTKGVTETFRRTP